MIASKFAQQFTPPLMRLTGDKSKIQLKRQFHQLPLTGTPSFTPADTRETIRLAKSPMAIGADGMSTLHLKKLAQGAINYLTNIFKLSISTGQIPEIWHKAIIIQILKPGKDNDIDKDWRSINLLRPAVKTLEKLLLPKILTHIFFTLLNMAYGRNTRHALHCRRSPQTLLLMKKTGSPNSARRARSDSCNRQCGPSTTARICLQHQHTGNNPSLALQLYAEQTSQCSFSAKRI